MSVLNNAQSPTAAASPQTAVQAGYGLERARRTWGWLFLSPWIIGFLLFTLLPMVASLALTFTNFDITQPENTRFIGLDNYVRMFNDPVMGVSLATTIRYGALALPLAILVPLALATLLNSKHLVAKTIFRTLFYMPYIVPVVSAVYIWNGYLNTESGWLNQILVSLGVPRPGPNWLYSTDWIYLALVLIGLWANGNAMLTMLAGMQGVPTELYEAAKVDGAGPVTTFRRVTLPMISPVIFYNLILAMIGLFRYFETPYILKEGTGEPGNATLFYNIYLYRTAFRINELGYGATLAWLLFVIALVVTIFLFLTARRWVYYAGGEE